MVIVIFILGFAAVFYGYWWLGKETAKQRNKENGYPSARKPTKAEMIAANERAVAIEDVLMHKKNIKNSGGSILDSHG